MITFALTWLALSVIFTAAFCRSIHLAKVASGEIFKA